jgi:hypothetical protein
MDFIRQYNSIIKNSLEQNTPTIKDIFGAMTDDQQSSIIGGAVSGVGGILQGLIGGRKRREEQRTAAAQLRQRTSQYENFQFENFYTGLQNPYEDLTVNTQAADFMAQQQQQGLANTLDSLRQSGGGLGAAALAQSLAQVQSQNLQQASASIAQQEQANRMAAAQGSMQLQMAEAGGAANVQAQEFGRTETLLGMSQARKAAADQARQQASSAFFGGIGNLAGSALSFGLSGGFSAIGAKNK